MPNEPTVEGATHELYTRSTDFMVWVDVDWEVVGDDEGDDGGGGVPVVDGDGGHDPGGGGDVVVAAELYSRKAAHPLTWVSIGRSAGRWGMVMVLTTMVLIGLLAVKGTETVAWGVLAVVFFVGIGCCIAIAHHE